MNNTGIHWFDFLFDADDIHQVYPDPRRWSTTIDMVTEYAKTEDEQWGRPETFADAYRAKYLTQTPF